MTNIHLREVPPAALAVLKLTAQANGRSLNAELVHLLTEEAEHLQRAQDFLNNVKPRKARRPVDLEALIQEGRDDRAPITP